MNGSKDMKEGTLGKQDTSPVTVGDFAVQAIVCKRLMDAFPDDGVYV
jgi:3'-phosphoadenosine 5'-phosphosulfate (PAPS) 3'-phosphatase